LIRIIPETLLASESNSYRPLYAAVTNWNHEGARAGNPVAQYNMFISLFEGRGTEPDMLRATNWLMRAAIARNGPAARWLSISYETGLLTNENPDLALKFLKVAAEAGDPSSIRRLAELYYKGERVERDYQRAWTLYSKAVELGDETSVYDLAWMAYYGQGVDKDPQKGIRLFEEAAEAGHAGAALKLARIHLNGWDVEADHDLAERLARQAIALGNSHGHHVLGMLHRDGLLGEVDYEAAFHHFEIAARDGFAESQLQMGYLLLWGRGVDRDLEESYSWYDFAARQGNERAATWLLYMQGLGWGTDQKPDSLVEYFSRISSEPVPELLKRRLMAALNSMPAAATIEGRDIDIGSIIEGTVYDGIDNYAKLTDAQQGQLYQYLHDKLESRKKMQVPPEDPVKEAEVAAAMQALWERELQSAILSAEPQGEFRPPRIFRSSPPAYPPIMRMLEVEDTVVAILEVGADGFVKDVSYDKEPLPQFRDAVEHVLPDWRFLPAIEDGKAVSCRTRLPIPFSLQKQTHGYDHE